MPAKKPKAEYAIQTVDNALRVLDAFREADDYGVTELSNRLGLHKNNVFRLLATLEEAGYVEQITPSDRYRLGVRSLELGRAFARSRTLHRVARPILQNLVVETGESAHLTLMRDFEVVCIDGMASSQAITTGSWVGRRLPVHSTAAGKVLLGGSSESVREEFDRTVVAGAGLAAHTPTTIVDPHKFFEHIRGVAVAGFALEIEESALGLSGAAAPVIGPEGSVVAALSVAGPLFRLSEDHLIREVAPAVVAAADSISRELGAAI
ncbi:IclR family transcriptional regulator [Myxococcota bacterium]|nr:IclR family transcriptional regulator [Myxococcota bacterium]